MSKKESMGGTLIIPDGYIVYNVDLDVEPPTCTIVKEDLTDEHKIEVPRALAYYLTTHHNGSVKFQEAIRVDAQNELRSAFRELLKHSDKSVVGGK